VPARRARRLGRRRAGESETSSSRGAPSPEEDDVAAEDVRSGRVSLAALVIRERLEAGGASGDARVRAEIARDISRVNRWRRRARVAAEGCCSSNENVVPASGAFGDEKDTGGS
jgi:hypothetical protein